MENEQKIRSHWTWIVSLSAFTLFNVMLQYWGYHMWTGDGLAVLWIPSLIGVLVMPAVGLYACVLFVVRNWHLIPPFRQVAVPLLGMLLLVGNLICFGFSVFFLVLICVGLFGNALKFFNDMFIWVFCF